MHDRIIAKASEDGAFRARLVADPKGAIRELTGTPMPDGVEVQVHQESATSFHLVLPPAGRLAEEEMAQVHGGVGSPNSTTDPGPSNSITDPGSPNSTIG